MTRGAEGSQLAVSHAFSSPPPVSQWTGAVREGRVVMVVDVPDPLADAPLTLPVRIVGWAYSRRGIDHVTVSIDGRSTRARYGIFRDDVVEALAEPEARNCGFTVLLEADGCAPGEHELSIVAVDREGHAVGRTLSIRCPVADDLSEALPDQALALESERYIPELHRGLPLAAEHQSRYSWAAPLAAGRDVLDAGCGVGWGTVALAQARARRVVGVDVDGASLTQARERAAGRETVEFVHGNLLDLPFPDELFDLVISFEAIEHVTDPQRALDELRRVLQPGGILVVSSPNRGIYPAGNPFHIQELTSEELEASLRQRFANVVMYRQQTHTTSLLSDDDTQRRDDADIAIDARVYKLSAAHPGEELYAIGLAGDSELPSLRNVVVLAEPPETKTFYERIAQLESRAMLAESKLAATQAALRDARSRASGLKQAISEGASALIRNAKRIAERR